uniref:Homeobox-containing protein n=1 Tax=Strongyloides stercoralis TaxID=6248 RepID=A0A0K0E026_STRER
MAFDKCEDENLFRDNFFGLHAFKPFRKCHSEKNAIFSGSREKKKFTNYSNNNISSILNEPNNDIMINKEGYNHSENKIFTSNCIDNIHNTSLNDDLHGNILTAYRRVPIKVLIGYSDCLEKKEHDNSFNYEDRYIKTDIEKVNEIESYSGISSKNIPISRPYINFEKMRASTRKCVE